MAYEGYPVPSFYFKVAVANNSDEIDFQEVSGLDSETEPVEYRHGNSPVFSKIVQPGMVKSSNVTLKRGIVKGNNNLWEKLYKIWAVDKEADISKIQQTVTITLMTSDGNAAMVWTLTNAWPTKITGPDLKSDGNDVSIESMEFVHEGLTIAPS